jgi:hypothetical protein
MARCWAAAILQEYRAEATDAGAGPDPHWNERGLTRTPLTFGNIAQIKRMPVWPRIYDCRPGVKPAPFFNPVLDRQSTAHHRTSVAGFMCAMKKMAS